VAQRPGTFVASYKAAIEALIDGRHLPATCKTNHFGNLRGKNAYKRCPGSVVIGALSVSIMELEWMARAYMADDPALFVSMDNPDLSNEAADKIWPWTERRNRRMRDGSLQSVEVDIHPDPRVQTVLEQIREAECIQSGDRCRPIFDEREIVFANNLVLDVTYDEILTHRELVQGGGRIERVLARTGVIPETRDELVRVYPDIFTSLSTAQRDVGAWLEKRYQNPNRISIWGMVPFSYRRPGQRGRPAKVWILAEILDKRAAAEAVLGELTMFEAVDEVSAPPVAPTPPMLEQALEPEFPPEPPAPPWRQPRPPLQVAPRPALPPPPQDDELMFWDGHEFFRPRCYF
jgi:hypothetical protein